MRRHVSYVITGVLQASELKELAAREGTAYLGQVFWRRRRRGEGIPNNPPVQAQPAECNCPADRQPLRCHGFSSP